MAHVPLGQWLVFAAFLPPDQNFLPKLREVDAAFLITKFREFLTFLSMIFFYPFTSMGTFKLKNAVAAFVREVKAFSAIVGHKIVFSVTKFQTFLSRLSMIFLRVYL